MRISLVALHAYPSPQAVPLANACLAAALGADEALAAVRVSLADFHAGDDPAACAATILDGEPQLVGFSVYLWNTPLTVAIARELRAARPGLMIFAGGPEPTATPERLLRAAPFDFLIVGEGEIPFVEAVGRIVRGGSPDGLDGVATMHGDTVSVGRQRPVRLLDTFPSPVLAGLLDDRASRGMLWELSRGCDFACAYCADVRAGAVRTHSLERLQEELDRFVRLGVPQLFVLDSTFNRDRQRAQAILKMIRATAPHIHCHFEVRSEFIDAAQAKLFAAIGCSLQIGLQSADPQVLARVGRHLDPADFRRRIGLLNREGVIFGFDLIYGLPGDTLTGFMASIDFALELMPNGLDIFPLAVLPGTPLAERADDLRIDRDREPPYLVRATPSFPPNDMARAARLAEACDILYSRGRAVAWFPAVARGAGLRPAQLLARFADWLEGTCGAVREEELADAEIWRMQRAFLATLFTGRRKRLLKPALDFVDYHYHYAEALLAVPPGLPTDREIARSDLLKRPLRLAPSARLARFSYELFDILEAGESDLAEFAAAFTPSGSRAVIYPRAGEVFTESLDEVYFRLLERLDGATPAGKLARGLGLDDGTAREFLEFALAEGIAVMG